MTETIFKNWSRIDDDCPEEPHWHKHPNWFIVWGPREEIVEGATLEVFNRKKNSISVQVLSDDPMTFTKPEFDENTDTVRRGARLFFEAEPNKKIRSHINVKTLPGWKQTGGFVICGAAQEMLPGTGVEVFKEKGGSSFYTLTNHPGGWESFENQYRKMRTRFYGYKNI